jgi:1-acyl-sn-glycerol-3-phosphate acyltransferase
LIVDRSSAMSRARSMVVLKKELQDGWNIFIYPEGSRNSTAEPLAPFYDGAFRIAIQSKAPIAVLVTKDMGNVSSTTKSVDLWPGTIHLHWCAFVETSQYKSDQVSELKELVIQTMRTELEK